MYYYVKVKNRIRLFLLLSFPFGALLLLPRMVKKCGAGRLIIAVLTVAAVFSSAFLPLQKTELSAQPWEYHFTADGQPAVGTNEQNGEFLSSGSSEKGDSSTVVTTTTVTKTKKGHAKSTAKKTKKTSKTTATVTTTSRPIIYLTDESEVYTNMSYSFMHTDYRCENLRGTVVIMTFKQSCRLAIPYCEMCCSTVLYVPPESEPEEDFEEQGY